MSEVSGNDLDYLTARLHGRRSRLAETGRLDSLCGIRSLPELASVLCPKLELPALGDLQRRLSQELVQEVSSWLPSVAGAGGDLVGWCLARFQIENIKVLLRKFSSPTPLEAPEGYLVSLPQNLALDAKSLLAAGSLGEFVRLLPPGPPRRSLRQALEIYREPRPFFLEGALDRGYFQELLARARLVTGEDQQLIQEVVLQEIDGFHLLLAARGKFDYQLAPELLLPLHVKGGGIPREQFAAMLAAADITAVARLAQGHGIDGLGSEAGLGDGSPTIDASGLEVLVWKRFWRLSNRAFRRSHLGLGAVVGYLGLKRVEIANLITLSEGIGLAMPQGALRVRMIPRPDMQSVYV